MKTLNFVNMTTSERDRFGELQTVKLPFDPVPESYHKFLITDIHTGNSATSISTVEEAVRMVRKYKRYRVSLLGDQFEAINVTDKRFDVACHGGRASLLNDQRDFLLELLDPLHGHVDVVLDGNHERVFKNTMLINKDVAKALGAVYANGTFAKLIYPKWRMGAWHGSGRINSRAGDDMQRMVNELIALKRNMRSLPIDDCEIAVVGHYHRLLLHDPRPRLLMVSDAGTNKLKAVYSKPGRIDTGKFGAYRVPEDDRYYMCCGAFLRAYEEDRPAYTEDWGVRASEMGFGHIEIKNGMPVKVELIKIFE